MDERTKAIRELHEQIEKLSWEHKAFQQKIQELQNAVFKLNLEGISDQPAPEQIVAPTPASTPRPVDPPKKIEVPDPPRKVEAFVASAPPPTTRVLNKERTPIEEFIGTNLLNKIGIAVLVIGIGIGAKYSIDNDLISPLTRIILGYVAGLALIGIAIKLKKGHENFSAVLLSGGMAVLYFITYAAYGLYDLIPQEMAFVLMVLFTGFTVFASLQYNREVVGIIGLVGAYAVPFLLSDGSGRVLILFSYVTIINAGILILAFKKYWKRLYYLAFILTWAIFSAWHTTQFDVDEHFTFSLVFGSVFFITFYITFLAYKLLRREPLSKPDLIFMLLNSFIFFTYGYVSIDALKNGDEFLGLFTVCTALIHFIACAIIYKQQEHFRDIFYFLAGMVLVFLTMAVPIQLEGNWVTLIWAAESLLLFWIGRAKQFPVYEKLSYPLIILATASLIHDWNNAYLPQYIITDFDTRIPFLLNVHFLTTVLVVISLASILLLNRSASHPAPFGRDTIPYRLIAFGLPLLTIAILYIGIFREIETFWNQAYADSRVLTSNEYGDTYPDYDYDLLKFQTIWLIIYSGVFAIALSFLQMKRIRNNNLLALSAAANALIILAFVTAGLFELSELRYSYLTDADNPYYYRDIDNILIRYVGIIVIAVLIYINHLYLKNDLFNTTFRQAESVFFHTTMIILLSSELIHWLDMNRVEESFKLALSVLWGLYALFLIVFGLRRNLKHIRVIAIVVFGVTLIKLFIYDIEDMSTIGKTIVMVILGSLLLMASFLYNKVKRTAQNESV